MHIARFKKSVWLSAPIERVFEFHENPHNIRKISPGSMKVQSVDADDKAVAGARFSLEATQYGLPISWIGEWESVESPHCLVDLAVKSPFKFFRHTHAFRAEGWGTRMTDCVEYALPFGPLGAIAAESGARVALMILFRARHRATVRYFAMNG